MAALQSRWARRAPMVLAIPDATKIIHTDTNLAGEILMSTLRSDGTLRYHVWVERLGSVLVMSREDFTL